MQDATGQYFVKQKARLLDGLLDATAAARLWDVSGDAGSASDWHPTTADIAAISGASVPGRRLYVTGGAASKVTEGASRTFGATAVTAFD